MAPTTIAFDLYGTILSTDSIGKELSKIFGDEKAKVIATQARRYQLEYSWRINGMGELLHLGRSAAMQSRDL
jgi:2-haloacid dehalogenase